MSDFVTYHFGGVEWKAGAYCGCRVGQCYHLGGVATSPLRYCGYNEERDLMLFRGQQDALITLYPVNGEYVRAFLGT